MDILDFFGHFTETTSAPYGAIFLFLFWSISFWLMANQVIFDIRWVVDKACICTMNSQW